MGEYAEERLAHLHPEVFGDGNACRGRRSRPRFNPWADTVVEIVDDDVPQDVPQDPIDSDVERR